VAETVTLAVEGISYTPDRFTMMPDGYTSAHEILSHALKNECKATDLLHEDEWPDDQIGYFEHR
jgi:hypothetical protein